jgi:ABC-type nitrate/sulfonate/bicarbonate transport system substrate-binding protein
MPDAGRRDFVKGAAAATAALTLSRPLDARAQTSVKIGTAVLGDYAMVGPVVVALEKGFFAQQGVSAEFIPFRGGPDLVKAVIAGEVLIGITGSTDILVFREAGSPIRMIATETDGNHFTLNVSPEIQKVADLRGKTIGVTRVGATTWVFARMVAKQNGMDPERDVKVVALGGLDAQLAALARKEIHGFVWGDGGGPMEAQGKSRVLLRFDSVTPKWISQIFYASEDAIRKQPDAIRKSLHAMFQAIRLMKTNTREAAEIISKKIGWSPDGVLAAHKISGPLLPEDGRINVDALRAMQDTLIEHGVIKKRLPIEEHFTTEFTPVKV